jgi:hypothetical protein
MMQREVLCYMRELAKDVVLPHGDDRRPPPPPPPCTTTARRVHAARLC